MKLFEPSSKFSADVEEKIIVPRSSKFHQLYNLWECFNVMITDEIE